MIKGFFITENHLHCYGSYFYHIGIEETMLYHGFWYLSIKALMIKHLQIVTTFTLPM